MTVLDLAEWPPDDVFDRLARDGYAELQNCVPDRLLDEARRQGRAAVERNGGEYIAIEGQAGLTGGLLADLHDDPGMRTLCASLYTRAIGRGPSQQQLLQLFRCLKGSMGQRESRYLHFDSYLITVIIPVDIPDREPTGDLILLRRQRALRQLYLVNLLQKLVCEFKPVQQALWWGIGRGWIRSTRLRLKHGSVYLFFGSTTLHANEPCAPDALRATLVFHFGNPHQRSLLRKVLGR